MSILEGIFGGNSGNSGDSRNAQESARGDDSNLGHTGLHRDKPCDNFVGFRSPLLYSVRA